MNPLKFFPDTAIFPRAWTGRIAGRIGRSGMSNGIVQWDVLCIFVAYPRVVLLAPVWSSPFFILLLSRRALCFVAGRGVALLAPLLIVIIPCRVSLFLAPVWPLCGPCVCLAAFSALLASEWPVPLFTLVVFFVARRSVPLQARYWIQHSSALSCCALLLLAAVWLFWPRCALWGALLWCYAMPSFLSCHSPFPGHVPNEASAILSLLHRAHSLLDSRLLVGSI